MPRPFSPHFYSASSPACEDLSAPFTGLCLLARPFEGLAAAHGSPTAEVVATRSPSPRQARSPSPPIPQSTAPDPHIHGSAAPRDTAASVQTSHIRVIRSKSAAVPPPTANPGQCARVPVGCFSHPSNPQSRSAPCAPASRLFPSHLCFRASQNRKEWGCSLAYAILPESLRELPCARP